MKKWLLSLFLLAGMASFASAQSYDLWLFDGINVAGGASAGVSVSPKGFAGLSSATVTAVSTTTNAGYIYRQTDWSNKWTNAVNVVNTAMTFSNAGGNSPDGRFSVTNGKYYTFNVPTTPIIGNSSQPFAILETAAAPITISSVTRSNPTPVENESVEITVTCSSAPGSDEFVYVVYSVNNWSSYSVQEVFFEGTSGTASLPGYSLGTTMTYYAMTSTVSSGSWGANRDVLTLKANTNGGLFYSYTVSAGPDETAPTTVSDLTATADEDLNQITLTWSPVTEDNFDTYEIYYNLTGSVTTADSKFDKNDYPTLGSRTTGTVTLTNLTWGETYYFRIRGVDASANAGELSNENADQIIGEPLVMMDGVFDGEEKWGPPVAVANGTAGWFDVNAKKLYITYDDTYVYFAAEVDYASWQKWVFLINTIPSAGGSVTAANDATTYGHAQLPDYAIVQNGGNAVLKVWNGSAWEDHSTSLTSGIWTGFTTTYIEVRLLKSMLNDVSPGDVQFYISGNNPSEHSSFDSVPDDAFMSSWNNPLTLSNYASGLTLPVELASFSGKVTGSDVLLTWTTATEKNNYGFEIQKLSGSTWNAIGFVSGNGTTTEAKSYSFTDKAVAGKASYRLKQQDLDGSVSYSQVVEVSSTEAASFKVSGNYPNPFNPATIVEFTLPSSGQVQFSVFNMLGQEVASSVLAGTAGLNQLHFRADGLSSGIYVYRVTFDGKSFTRTMSILK